jgi:hypothetical protein
MPHGHKDYGPTSSVSTVYAVLDMAELAARLRSVDTFDRRGNVLFLEDFQGDLAKLQTGTSGSGGSVSISAARARFGSFSCKMTTGDSTGNKAFVAPYLPYQVLSKIGVEFSWCPQSWLSKMELLVTHYTGSAYYQFYIRWNYTNDSWEYQDSAGAWQTLSPTALYARDVYTFNFTKLVMDLETDQYVRLVANEHTYDLADIAAWTDASSTVPSIIVEVTAYTRADNSCTVYLGHLLVTQNEP